MTREELEKSLSERELRHLALLDEYCKGCFFVYSKRRDFIKALDAYIAGKVYDAIKREKKEYEFSRI